MQKLGRVGTSSALSSLNCSATTSRCVVTNLLQAPVFSQRLWHHSFSCAHARMSSDAAQYVAVISEFVEALVHQTLFLREVYDPDLFTRTRLYGIAVRKCTHPDVIAYVQQLTQSLKDGLERGTLAKVIIVILDQSAHAVEKHGLDIRLLVPDKVRQMSPLELEAALRSVLLKQQYTKDILQPLPAGCTFTTLACMSGGAELPQDVWAEEVGEHAVVAPQGYAISAPHELQPVKTTKVANTLQLQLVVDSSLFTTLQLQQ